MDKLRGPQLSRREFFKVMGISLMGAAGVAIKADKTLNQTALVSTLFNTDTEFGFDHRKHILVEGLKKSVGKPEVFGSLVKLMAAEVYTNSQSLLVTRDTVRSFMFGNGGPLNITHSLIESVRKNPQWLDNKFDPIADPNELVLQTISSVAKTRSAQIPNESTQSIRHTLNTQTSTNINLAMTNGPTNADMVFAMNRYKIQLKGYLTNITHSGGSYYGCITGEATLTDRYDYDERHSDLGRLDVAHAASVITDYLGYIGIPDPVTFLSMHMKKDAFNHLMSQEVVTYEDADGLRLQENGICTPFDIKSSWGVVNMAVEIPKATINA